MSSQSRSVSSAFGIFILNLYIVLVVFSAIGAVTSSPQSYGSNSKTSGANKSKQKAYTVNVVEAKNTHSHTFEQSFSPNGALTGTTGKYTVLLPDGRTQIVNYIADENGYRTVGTYENTKYETSARATDNVQVLDNVKAPDSEKEPDNEQAPPLGSPTPSPLVSPTPAPLGSPTPSATRSPDCNILPSPGECRGAFPRVFFNSTSSQCDCFLWGGCDDEGNEKTTSSWLSLEECSATCFPENTKPGPRCRPRVEQETQTFATPPLPNIAEAAHLNATAHLNDTEFLDSLIGN